MTRNSLIPKWVVLTLLISVAWMDANSQPTTTQSKPKIMVLGSFHFNYPNLDILQTEEKDKIDITSKERQQEVFEVIEKLKNFNPSKIAVEISISEQLKIDSFYNAYLNDLFELPKSESFQIGFRLAKELGHKKVYCIDEWGNINYFYKTEDNINYELQSALEIPMQMFEAYTDSLLQSGEFQKDFFPYAKLPSGNSISDILFRLNQPEFMKNDHARYLNTNFIFEARLNDYLGADFIALTWYSRNLRIYRNIVRITEKPEDKILIIYGSGHGYLLNQFVNESGQYQNVSPLTYLK